MYALYQILCICVYVIVSLASRNVTCETNNTIQIASDDLFSFFNLLLGFLTGDCGTVAWMQDVDVSICLRFSSTNTQTSILCQPKIQENMFLSIKQPSELMELSSNSVSNNHFLTTIGHRKMNMIEHFTRF